MNKKPGLVFAVCAFAMIILAAALHMDFGGAGAVKLREGVDPNNVLYVCKITESGWTTFAETLTMVKRYLSAGFIFAFIILAFSWAWALYQNMVKDKFNENAYKTPWGMTKIFFWAMVACIILSVTPNHFRTVRVHLKGRVVDMVLCEKNSENAIPVNPKAITLH